MKPRESGITERAAKLLRSRGHLVRKLHGSVFSVKGDPDLYGARRPDGRAFAVEMKAPGEQPSELQHKRLAEWAEAGAVTGWATSPDEALAIVEQRQ